MYITFSPLPDLIELLMFMASTGTVGVVKLVGGKMSGGLVLFFLTCDVDYSEA